MFAILPLMDTAAPAQPMNIQTFRARLAESTVYNDKFIQLHFELIEPNRLKFRAGQYLQLTVPGTPQKKSYSICSDPQVDHAVAVLVDVTPHGPGSNYLENLKPGEEVTFMAPFGRFVVEPRETPVGSAEKNLVFVATGSGIAPIRAMLEDLLIYQADDRPMTLHWGLRQAGDQCWYEDFELLSQQHPNFRFHPVLSQAPDSWPLCRGRVTDCLMVHDLPPDAGYYLCGSAAMIADVRDLLLKKGVTEEHVHHEKFY